MMCPLTVMSVSTISSGNSEPVRAAGDDVLLAVWVMPGASRSEVVGIRDGQVRLRLAAPAQEGRANAELVRVIAKLLGRRRNEVTIEMGASARHKLVRVAAATSADVVARLGV
jgi:uncharacterized protein (TIGR00251 family)